ncbi:hypothetical protein TWF225_007497 [Orbilia oligospora]|nr:hypothetical protein TWF225_007497 [Orbilia oligospora]
MLRSKSKSTSNVSHAPALCVSEHLTSSALGLFPGCPLFHSIPEGIRYFLAVFTVWLLLNNPALNGSLVYSVYISVKFSVVVSSPISKRAAAPDHPLEYNHHILRTAPPPPP